MPEFDSTIQYRDIQNFPGYKVGSDGTVWSARKIAGFGKNRHSIITDKWKRLLANPGLNGYPIVTLCPALQVFYVHRLVLEAFVGPCPDGMESCHNDGNRSNNHVSNLRWDTRKGNFADCVKHGTRNYGENNGVSKLTDDLVRRIREEYATGKITQRELAAKYECAQMTVSCIIRRITWKHI